MKEIVLKWSGKNVLLLKELEDFIEMNSFPLNWHELKHTFSHYQTWIENTMKINVECIKNLIHINILKEYF